MTTRRLLPLVAAAAVGLVLRPLLVQALAGLGDAFEAMENPYPDPLAPTEPVRR